MHKIFINKYFPQIIKINHIQVAECWLLENILNFSGCSIETNPYKTFQIMDFLNMQKIKIQDLI